MQPGTHSDSTQIVPSAQLPSTTQPLQVLLSRSQTVGAMQSASSLHPGSHIPLIALQNWPFGHSASVHITPPVVPLVPSLSELADVEPVSLVAPVVLVVPWLAEPLPEASLVEPLEPSLAEAVALALADALALTVVGSVAPLVSVTVEAVSSLLHATTTARERTSEGLRRLRAIFPA